jgi:hypothetical protein
MAEPASTDSQQANTPARQLLAALNQASQDMEKAVNESCDHVTGLNARLERLVNAQIDETAEQVELLLRGHLDGLSSEKDVILSQLTELRQEELKVLQTTGKILRQSLMEKLDLLVNNFAREVDKQLQLFREKLEQAANENSLSVEATRKSLREGMPAYLSAIIEEISKEKLGLEERQSSCQQILSQQSIDSLTELAEHHLELKNRLESEGEAFLTAVDESAQTMVSGQTGKLDARKESFSSIEQEAGKRIDSLSGADKNYICELPRTFEESCQEMAELQVGLHTTLVKNLALQYRTEILSASQEAEDQLQIVRAELQSMLRQFQNRYAEQYENLLTRFEKSAADFLDSRTPSEDVAGNPEQSVAGVNDRFAVIRKTVSESVKDRIAATEAAMERTYEDFRIRLENARLEYAEKIDSSFKENQEELARVQQSNDEHLGELSQKMQELELRVNEARELIRALGQADLNF